MQPAVQSGFNKRILVFSWPGWDSMSGSAAWTNTSSLQELLRVFAAPDTQILETRCDLMVALPFGSGSCVRCCLGRSAASVSFLRGGTLWKLYSYTTKKTNPKTPQIDWRKRLTLTKGERTTWGGPFWFRTCESLSDGRLSLFRFTCISFSFRFWLFPSPTEGCKREIVHHIPHVLWW